MTTPHTHTPTISAHSSRAEMGRKAGLHAASSLRQSLQENESVRLMLAAAPSQQPTLTTLAQEPGIDWGRVVCFHMDDYLQLAPEAPQGFANWLRRTFLSQLPDTTFHSIVPTSTGDDEAARYGRILGETPFDLVLLGLGVNGHLAFNDPPADFYDPQPVRVVDLDVVSRQQQVDEGHFQRLQDVPRQAVTVTIPRLLNAREVIASVPGWPKRKAVADTLYQPIGGEHPGTALRLHPNVTLYLDAESDPR